MSALTLRAGPTALARIREQGLDPSMVEIVPGASGGPKWLILSGLDRALWGEFLLEHPGPLQLIGSSIGSWRFACAAQDDPLAALERFETAYVEEQQYSAHPSPAEVSAVAAQLLEALLGESGARQIVVNARRHSHIVTVRCTGLAASERRRLQMAVFGLGGLGNLLSRRTLGWWLQRVIFHTAGDTSPFRGLRDLPSADVPLSEANLRPALLASGAIPMLLQGVHDIPGGGAGTYRDGGIIDYHLDLPYRVGSGLVLYPHFYPYLVPGWFDKGLPWRRARGHNHRHTLLLAPSAELVAELPYGKIPDRRDFTALDREQRRRYWRRVLQASRRMGEEFLELVASGRIRQAVRPL